MRHEHSVRQWIDGRCSSGKRGFVDRAGAKVAARHIAKSGSPGLRPYRCEECGYWHNGHKPEAVVRGEYTADEWYGKEA